MSIVGLTCHLFHCDNQNLLIHFKGNSDDDDDDTKCRRCLKVTLNRAWSISSKVQNAVELKNQRDVHSTSLGKDP